MIVHRLPAYWRESPAVRVYVVLMVVFVISNTALMVVMDRSPENALTIGFAGVAAGMVAAQVVLHSIWMVFANWRLTRRLIVSFSTALVLCFSLIWILLVQLPVEETLIAIASTLLCMPLLALSIQTPLWMIKVIGRGEIVPAHVATKSGRERGLKIRDILLATGAVGVAFAAVRLLTSLDGGVASTFILMELLLVATVLSVTSLITAAVAVLVTLRARHVTFSTQLAIVIQTVLYVGWGFVMFLHDRSPPPLEALLLFFGTFASFMVFLYGPLIYLRYHGYRLR